MNLNFNTPEERKDDNPVFGLPKFDEVELNVPDEYKDRNFLDVWLDINSGSKSPVNFFRWTGLSLIATLLERNVYLPFAGNALYPNMYVLIVGEAASNKSTAIIESKEKLESVGYPNFSPNRLTLRSWFKVFSLQYKTRKGAYETGNRNTLKQDVLSKVLDIGLYDDEDLTKQANRYRLDEYETTNYLEQELETLALMADNKRVNALGCWASEFSEFVPSNSAPLIYSLTDLYDTHAYNFYEFEPEYGIYNPCVNLIGAITPSALALKFDVNALEAGFLTRCILVHSEPKRQYIDPLDQGINLLNDSYTQSYLRAVRNLRGTFEVSDEARNLAKEIAKFQPKINDIRLKSYQGRRYAHLMKIAMCRAAGDLSLTITEDHLMWANSVLTFTEQHMTDALGDFGSSVDQAIKTAVVKVINNHTEPVIRMSNLLEQTAQLRPKENTQKIIRVIADMVKSKVLIRKDADSVNEESILYLKTLKENKLTNLDGSLFDSTLIPEWEI
jgi:hypothetical protein